MITSVWSTHGHRFISDGGEDTESCLTCGAMYFLMASDDDPTNGEYVSGDGNAPMDCTRDTGMAHGYPGERFCHEHPNFPRETSCDGTDECSHVTHDCNCLLCA